MARSWVPLVTFAVNTAIALFLASAVLSEVSVYHGPQLTVSRTHVVGGVVAALCVAVPVLWLQRSTLTYSSVRWFVTALLQFFFRQISVNGLENIPATGPVILVGSHRNQFVDAALLLASSPRHPLSLTMAAASFSRPVVGAIARGVGVIPVHRPQDDAVAGAGSVSGAEGSQTLKGADGSMFTAQVGDGASLLLRDAEGERTLTVARVLSDTELELSAPLSAAVSGVAYKVAKRVDHSQMFSSVFEELARGRTVAIFPEGGSHDRTHQLPLKAGVALMALGAVEKHPHLSVTIVPCGLNYSSGGHKFRSKALVDFGEPIVISAAHVPQFKTNKREAVSSLLTCIEAGLKSVTLNVPDHEFLEFVLTVKRLYQPANIVLSPAQSFALTHRFAEGLQMPSIQSDPRFAEVRDDVRRYRRLCRSNGFNPYSTVVIRRSLYGIRIIPQLLVVLCFSLLAAIPGLLLNAPVGLAAKFFAERQAAAALKKSSVKIRGLDVVASYKLIYIMVLMPLWSLLLVSLVLWLTPLRWSIVLPGALLFPLFGYLGIRFTEQGVIWSKAVMPLLLRTLPSYRTEEDSLLLLQESLKQRIRALADELDHPYKDRRIITREQIDAAEPEQPEDFSDDLINKILVAIGSG